MIPKILALLLMLISLEAIGQEQSELDGCWQATISELYDNVATLCLEGKLAYISYYFTNVGTESPATTCYQQASIELKDNSILMKGEGGPCENGMNQGEITFRCRPAYEPNMRCEMFFSYTEFEATKIE